MITAHLAHMQFRLYKLDLHQAILPRARPPCSAVASMPYKTHIITYLIQDRTVRGSSCKQPLGSLPGAAYTVKILDRFAGDGAVAEDVARTRAKIQERVTRKRTQQAAEKRNLLALRSFGGDLRSLFSPKNRKDAFATGGQTAPCNPRR